jgi:hypothetical protein
LDEPTRIAGQLASMAAAWGMENPLESARIVARWRQIVGPDIAAKCRPTSLRAGVLKVRTDSPAWASEFRFVAPQVIGRINADLGRTVVHEIKPWVGPPVKDNRARREGRSRAHPEPALTADSRVLAEADAMAANIGDERVAEALRRALVAAKIRQGKRREVVQLIDTQGAQTALSRSRSGPRGSSHEQPRSTVAGAEPPRRDRPSAKR